MSRLGVAALVLPVGLGLAGCTVNVQMPEVPASHPASSEAASAPLPEPSPLLASYRPVERDGRYPAAHGGMDHSGHEGMDHSSHEEVDHSGHEEMDHSGMDHSGQEGMDHSGHEGMDHSGHDATEPEPEPADDVHHGHAEEPPAPPTAGEGGTTS